MIVCVYSLHHTQNYLAIALHYIHSGANVSVKLNMIHTGTHAGIIKKYMCDCNMPHNIEKQVCLMTYTYWNKCGYVSIATATSLSLLQV